MATTVSPGVDYLMEEWAESEWPRRLRASVRRVLNELSTKALLCLKDKRLEVRLVSTPYHYSVWAYFPIWPRWTRTVREMAACGITFNPKAAGPLTLELHTERAYGNARLVRRADAHERVRIVRELLPRAETRVLLLF